MPLGRSLLPGTSAAVLGSVGACSVRVACTRPPHARDGYEEWGFRENSKLNDAAHPPLPCRYQKPASSLHVEKEDFSPADWACAFPTTGRQRGPRGSRGTSDVGTWGLQPHSQGEADED